MDTTQVTFDEVRQNIVEFLSSNPTFKDYNFTAPAISTLIDALAYTSHYLIRYANFSVNESGRIERGSGRDSGACKRIQVYKRMVSTR